jgi:hypothetical protein
MSASKKSLSDERVGRWLFFGAVLLTGVAAVGVSFVARRTTAATPPAPLDVCAEPGVHLELEGSALHAGVARERDLAGHKYRRDGSRSPWFTAQGGPLYVHGVGAYLPRDVGTTQLSLLTVKKKGESDGYALANAAQSVLEVQGSNGKHIHGRFEADMSKVADTTRPPPAGAPVVRVRGTFCLPALAADPSDTGP